MGFTPTSNTVEQSQASSATQYAMPAKANWRQARPPKPADTKQEQPDPDLQAGAAFLAGAVNSTLSWLHDSKPAA